MRFFLASAFVHLLLVAVLLGASISQAPVDSSGATAPPQIVDLKGERVRPSSEPLRRQNTLAESASEENAMSEPAENPGGMGPSRDSLLTLINQRKVYPADARRLRQQGQVIVRFEVSALGEVQNVTLVEPSKFVSLNSAALDLLKKMPRLEPRLNTETFTLPIDYRLR